MSHLIYHESALHKINVLHDAIENNHNATYRAVRDGKVGCNPAEYTVAFLYSDMLYFYDMLKN